MPVKRRNVGTAVMDDKHPTVAMAVAVAAHPIDRDKILVNECEGLIPISSKLD